MLAEYHLAAKFKMFLALHFFHAPAFRRRLDPEESLLRQRERKRTLVRGLTELIHALLCDSVFELR